MLKVSLRSLLAHKLRLLLTVLAVTVGVAFVSGTFVLSDTMSKAFDELYTGLTKGTDVAVRAKAAYTDITTQGQLRPLDDDLRRHRRRRARRRRARGQPHRLRPRPRQGRRADPARRRPHPRRQRPGEPAAHGQLLLPRRPRRRRTADEVALDAATAEKAGFAVGDDVTIVLEGGPKTFTLAGITGFGETDSLAGATMASFEMATAQELLGKTGKVDQINIAAADGVDRRRPAGRRRGRAARPGPRR